MLPLLRTFFEIAVWRKGPQDLPASTALLAMALGVYVALSFAQIRFVGYGFRDAAVLVTIDVAMTCMWILGALNLLGFRSRLTQALTAIFGAGALLVILDIALRALALWLNAPKAIDQLALPQLLISLLVLGRILMITLERGLLMGMSMCFAMFLSILFLTSLVVDPLAAAQ